jgi:lipoic acid synthetase/lipoyl(octanoyl) transferase
MKACAIFFDQPISYRDGVILQEAILEARIKDQTTDAVLFLEHLPVITCGVRSKPEQILLSDLELKVKNIDISKSSRGGAATYHAPGQLIMYPIIKLGADLSGTAHDKTDPGFAEASARGYLYYLEEVAIRTAKSFGVTAYRRPKMTGAWTDEGKLAAIGVRFKRWVSYHGMSFNVNPDMSGFSTIVPCGLANEKVVSLQALLGKLCPSLDNVRRSMAAQFESVFKRKLDIYQYDSFSADRLPLFFKFLETKRRNFKDITMRNDTG